jgi:hypothetical protein
MKKNVFFALLIILLASYGFGGCKKDNDRDFTPLFKNSMWTGEFNYPTKAAEPISIEFSEDGNLTWRELLAAHAGTWKLNKGKLNISLDGSHSFTADISDNDDLTNIQNSDAAQRTLKNATLSKGDIPALANTVWSASNVTLKFKSGSVLDLSFGGPTTLPTYTNVPYTLLGRSIRFELAPGYIWFTVITTSTFMKGTNHAPGDATVYTFSVIKQ